MLRNIEQRGREREGTFKIQTRAGDSPHHPTRSCLGEGCRRAVQATETDHNPPHVLPWRAWYKPGTHLAARPYETVKIATLKISTSTMLLTIPQPVYSKVHMRARQEKVIFPTPRSSLLNRRICQHLGCRAVPFGLGGVGWVWTPGVSLIAVRMLDS